MTAQWTCPYCQAATVVAEAPPFLSVQQRLPGTCPACGSRSALALGLRRVRESDRHRRQRLTERLGEVVQRATNEEIRPDWSRARDLWQVAVVLARRLKDEEQAGVCRAAAERCAAWARGEAHTDGTAAPPRSERAR